MRWLVVIVLAVAAMPARAQESDEVADLLKRAKELEANLAYDEALQLAGKAIAIGRSPKARNVELHLLAGRLAAGLDRRSIAENHFAMVLALEPQLAPFPDGTSPKILDPWNAMRARNVPLEVRVKATKGSVALDVVADPLGLVTGIEVKSIRDGVPKEHVEQRTSVTIEPGATIVEVAALDRYNNVLWVGTPPPAPTEIVSPPHDRPLFGRWSTWAVITGVALTSGAIAAWRFDSAQNQWDRLRAEPAPEFSELEAIERRGDRWGLAANISFGVAAATGLATIYFAVRGSDEPAVSLAPGPGVGAGVAGRF